MLTIEHFRGRDGIEIDQPSGTIFTLRGGKIARMQSFWERENALGRRRAVGVVGSTALDEKQRSLRSASAAVELQYGMELDPVRRNSGLAVKDVEEANSGERGGALQLMERRR